VVGVLRVYPEDLARSVGLDMTSPTLHRGRRRLSTTRAELKDVAVKCGVAGWGALAGVDCARTVDDAPSTDTSTTAPMALPMGSSSPYSLGRDGQAVQRTQAVNIP
jgi:hypothetical protein